MDHRLTPNFPSGSSGFTLVELLLYIGLTTIMLAVISSFVQLMFEARNKHQSIAEVEQQGQLALGYMAHFLRDAKAVCAPAINTSGTSLSVDTGSGCGVNAPTVFDLSGGRLRVKEAAATQVDLTNSRVTITSFTVRDLTIAGGRRSLRISFTADYAGGNSRNEFTYTQTFQVAGSLR